MGNRKSDHCVVLMITGNAGASALLPWLVQLMVSGQELLKAQSLCHKRIAPKLASILLPIYNIVLRLKLR